MGNSLLSIVLITKNGNKAKKTREKKIISQLLHQSLEIGILINVDELIIHTTNTKFKLQFSQKKQS